MKGTHLLSLITAGLWALLILMGIKGVGTVRSQHIPGWPSPGQVHYYVYIPAVMFTLIVAAWAITVRWQRVKVFAVTVTQALRQGRHVTLSRVLPNISFKADGFAAA